MEYYDFQMIEGCKVYSYSVECPSRPTEKKRIKPTVSSQGKSNVSKKRLLTVLLLLLSPIAFLLDMLYAAISYLPRKLFVFIEKRKHTGIIGTVSCFLILSVVLLTVL